MTQENELWKEKVEPNELTKFNKDYATRCSYIIPGATQKFIAMAAYAIKPPSLKHFELTDEQCRDFWLSYSNSSYSDFLIEQFRNLRVTIKKGSVDFIGKRY